VATLLQEASNDIGRSLDVAFRLGTASAQLADYLIPADLGRDIDLEPSLSVVSEAMDRFDTNRARSDAWIGPRLHSALRLDRREAARRGIWRYFAAVACPDYVRWRWISSDSDDGEAKPAPLERFVGPDYKHAFARLWWMAEVFRNGPDYGAAERALSVQDITNNLFRMDIAHHRPTAQAAVNVLVPQSDAALTGREANALAKAINTTATTIAVDLIAPDTPLDEAARAAWITDARDIDVTLLLASDLPRGPDDEEVPPQSVKVMEDLLRELLAEAPIRGRTRPAADEQSDGAKAPAAG
jgi:hypothetical protein